MTEHKRIDPGVLRLVPMTGRLGAEVFDIDLHQEQPESRWGELRQALSDHGVLFFHDQTLGPAQFLEAASHFGTVVRTPIAPNIEGFENVAEMRKEADQERHVGSIWHTDMATRPHPIRATFLLGREIPAQGGDTCFISTAHAYAALSDGLKRTLEGLRVVHSDIGAARRYAAATGTAVPTWEIEEAIHPAVIHLPESGKPALYVNPADTLRFEGWTEEESAGLLHYLYQHCKRPEFSCRFRWREGAVCVIDDYQTWHYAVDDYFGHRRMLHRTMVTAEMFT